MRDIYHIIRQHDLSALSGEELSDYAGHCGAAAMAINSALEVIGNLTYDACQSEDYSPEDARRDLFHIGAVLRFLPRLGLALSDNSDNATFEQAKRMEKAK